MNRSSARATSYDGRGEQGRLSSARTAPTLALLGLFVLAGIPVKGEDDSKLPAADLPAIERAFQDVVARVSPSVVGIRARRHTLATTRAAGDAADRSTVEQVVVLNGSGTILRADGAILTNEHLIQAAEEIEIVLHDGRTLAGTVLASDARSDLAILQVDAAGLTPAGLCEWENVARGQWSVAIGNPYGLGSDGKLSVSVGVISNLGRRLPGLGEVDDRLYADMIQTTAPIHPGNSGGPLFNIRGELIGVVTAVHTRSVDDDGVGFAIPMTPARRRVIDGLLAGRPVPYGYLGLTVRAPERGDRETPGQDSRIGVVVEQVEAGGPAAKAGVRVGDVITHYDGQPLDAPVQLAELVGHTPVGRDVELRVRRQRTLLVIQARLEERQVSRVGWMRGGAVAWRGLRLADLSAASRHYVKATGDTGVVVIGVREGSPADRAHLKIGDVIEAVDRTAVREAAAFLPAVRGRSGVVELQVRNRGTIAISP